MLDSKGTQPRSEPPKPYGSYPLLTQLNSQTLPTVEQGHKQEIVHDTQPRMLSHSESIHISCLAGLYH